MKKKLKYFLSALIILVFVILWFSTTSYAGTQKLNSLNYDVELNSDGTAKISETWDIQVYDTNTLFKTFDLDETKYGEITNVKVSEITKTGEEVTFEDTKEYSYHVKKGGFYGLKTNSKEFEIAWGVSISSRENRKYKISYEVKDAVKTYNDCSEFYWQFIGEKNEIPADRVIGTIKLPKGVNEIDNLRVWAHGPLEGNIERVDNKTVSFDVSKLSAEAMVEVRIATLENVFTLNKNISKVDKFDSIIKEETKWANRANNERIIIIALEIALIIVSFGIIILFICLAIKYAIKLYKTTVVMPETKYDYFRDFPDEDATPAEAAFLYYFNKQTAFTNNISKIVSATLLSLARKKAISFEQDEKSKIYITVNNSKEIEKLKQDETNIWELLYNIAEYKKTISKSEEDIKNIKISMGDIEQYAKNKDKQFLSKIESLEKIAKAEETKKGNYDEKTEKLANKWSNKSVVYYILTFVFICMLFLIVPIIFAVPCLICAVLCTMIAKKTRALTQKGVNEREKWRALKRYMEDFSLLKEREVPELILWEKYLVYATAFGISDKVLQQLKIKYPELQDENFMINNGYSYIYMMNKINFDRAVVSGMQKAYGAGLQERAARNYSSGGGYRRRVLWRWTAAGGRWPDGMGGR